jgi:signal transduction histidine kinase
VKPRPKTDKAAGRVPLQTTVLHGPWLYFARLAWVALAALTVALFVASVPAAYEQLRTVCEGAACAAARLSPEGAKTLEGLGLSPGFYAAYNVILAVLVALGFWAVGALLFWKSSGQLMALYASIALVTFGTVQADILHWLAVAQPSLELLIDLVYFVGAASFFVLFCVFPDGRFVPRWTRLTAAAWVAYQLLNSFFPEASFGPGKWPPLINGLVTICLIASLALAQIYRYRRVSGFIVRQQTKWVVLSLVVVTALFCGVVSIDWILALTRSGIQTILYQLAGSTVVNISTLLIPLSFSMSILRHRLWDIDLIIRGSLVYGPLSVVLVAVFAIMDTLLLPFVFRFIPGVEDSSSIITVASVLIVVVLLKPLHARIQAGVDRLIVRLTYGEQRRLAYRERPDSNEAVVISPHVEAQTLSRVAKPLEIGVTPSEVLKTVVKTVTKRLKVPYAAITLKQDNNKYSLAAEFGNTAGSRVLLPLLLNGKEVGQLILDFGGIYHWLMTALSPSRERRIEDLAQEVGVAVSAVRLSADLQRSRERLVTAREEERRRMQRDLHDSTLPQLSSLGLINETARQMLKVKPKAADQYLVKLASQLKVAESDVRRLTNELGPIAVEEVGLVGAIEQHVANYSLPGQDGVDVKVDAPKHPPPLRPAVESAAYLIAKEAIQNVNRHAHARNCWIRLWIDSADKWLELEIIDDGRGLPKGQIKRGKGLGTMPERAEELGGKFDIEDAPGGGTRVYARLPLNPTKE